MDRTGVTSGLRLDHTYAGTHGQLSDGRHGGPQDDVNAIGSAGVSHAGVEQPEAELPTEAVCLSIYTTAS